MSKAIGFLSDGPALPLFFILYWYANLPYPIAFALFTTAFMIFHEVVIKGFFHRKRPLSARGKKGLSFPSSHSFASGFIITLCLLLTFPFEPYLVVAAIVNALNRPALGVHYIADVIAGLTLGALLALCWALILRIVGGSLL